MPRRPSYDPLVMWCIRVPSSLAARVDLMLWDPALRTVKWGGRNAIITEMLNMWLDRTTSPDGNVSAARSAVLVEVERLLSYSRSPKLDALRTAHELYLEIGKLLKEKVTNAPNPTTV